MIQYIMQITSRLNREFVELYLFDPVRVVIIKSLLEDAGIEHYFKGEHFYLMEPLLGPVRLMVRKEDAEVAREILGL